MINHQHSGDYDYKWHNCRHFTNAFFQRVKMDKSIVTQNCNGNKQEMLQQYISEYFCDNYILTSNIGDKNKMLAGDNDNDNKKDDDVKNQCFEFFEGHPITFAAAVDRFRMTNTRNYVKCGFLYKESRYLNVWRKRYCVLKKNQWLYTFTDEKMTKQTEDIPIKAALVQNDTHNGCIFYVSMFSFKAESQEIANTWIDAIKEVGGRNGEFLTPITTLWN